MYRNYRRRQKLRKIAILGLLYLMEEEEKEKSERRYWVHPINTKREADGEYETLVPELKLYPERFYTYFRMGEEQFEYILEKVTPLLKKKTTNYRKTICTEQRLVVGLRYVCYFFLYL